MIHSREGHPISPEALSANRARVGYVMEKWGRLREYYQPEVDGLSSPNVHLREAVTPVTATAVIRDINSKYGVFFLRDSEVAHKLVRSQEQVEL
ncbi:MAG TPA: hypothetical protein VFP35_03560 [Candidatus Saccharimonadales bacterium]|nr:hypothetical protein [Candidatus Saccharimonadales bacterium]